MNSVLEGFRVRKFVVILDEIDAIVDSGWEMTMIKFLGMKDMKS